MSMKPIAPISDESEDHEEQQLRARRLFTYSTDAIRIGSQVDKIFVTHSGVEKGLEAMDRVYQLSRTVNAVQGIRLVGPTGCGKTTLIRYFRASLPPDDLLDNNTRTLLLRVQERPAVGRLISSMLRLVQYPFAKVTHQNEYAKKDILIEALRQKETKVLFLDEAHHLCQARNANRPDRVGTNATDFIRELIDEVPLAVVLAGDTNLDRLPEVDSHLAARTAVRIALNNFDAGPIWSGIVKALTSQKFGVELGMLQLPKERQRLLAATNGNLRQLKWLVSEAVMVCADAGGAEVLPLHLSLAFDRVHGVDSLRSNPYKG